MNVIFTVIFLVSVIILCFISPDSVLATMIQGGENALELSLHMCIIYAVWLGVFEIIDRSGLSIKIARLLRPINRFLFGDLPDKANEYACLNISANMLGMSGATTPMGIKTIHELEKFKNSEYAIYMFFVINATSIQLIPTSVISLRTSLQSASPSDILLPTVLTTALSSLIGILLVKIFIKKPKGKLERL